jgi:hypothetical protein
MSQDDDDATEEIVYEDEERSVEDIFAVSSDALFDLRRRNAYHKKMWTDSVRLERRVRALKNTPSPVSVEIRVINNNDLLVQWGNQMMPRLQEVFTVARGTIVSDPATNKPQIGVMVPPWDSCRQAVVTMAVRIDSVRAEEDMAQDFVWVDIATRLLNTGLRRGQVLNVRSVYMDDRVVNPRQPDEDDDAPADEYPFANVFVANELQPSGLLIYVVPD